MVDLDLFSFVQIFVPILSRIFLTITRAVLFPNKSKTVSLAYVLENIFCFVSSLEFKTFQCIQNKQECIPVGCLSSAH